MKTIVIFIVAFILSVTTKSQITLEHIYNNAATYYSYNNQLFLVKFEANGERYAKIDKANRLISFYNLNHVLISSISLAAYPDMADSGYSSSFSIIYLSDHLFNLDDKIEFMYISSWGSLCYTGIYNEDGNVLLSVTDEAPWIQPNYHQQQYPVYNTAQGTKLIMSTVNNQAKVYSLPGLLTTNIEQSNFALLNNYYSNMKIFPNPATDFITIDYELPTGISEGEIIVFDNLGNKIKNFKVNNKKNQLSLVLSDFPSGIYYYILQTDNNINSSKKLIIIK